METIVRNVTLTVINCGKCAGTYAINERYREKKHEEGGSWNCPYCKVGWGYFGDNTETGRLRNELAREKHRREQAQAALQDLDSSLDRDVAQVAREARRYRNNKRLLSAFWNGASKRNCGALPTDCPYQSPRFGFRAAWFAGAGIEEVVP